MSRARLLRRSLAGAAVLAAAFAGHAYAQAPAWHDAGAVVPQSVDLAAIALHRAAEPDGAVVAVGRDTASGVAAVYRYAGGAWRRETVAGLPAGSRLVDVAVSETAAWAVGSYEDGGSARPLALRFPGGGARLATDGGSWAPISADDLPTAAPLTAVAIAGGDGVLGDAAGRLHRFTDAGDGGWTSTGAVDAFPAGPSRVAAVALRGAGTGVAVGGEAADALRFYDLEDGRATAALSDPDAARLRDVVAPRAVAALAIEATGYWERGGDRVWRRASGQVAFQRAGTELRSVTAVAAGAEVVDAIVGAAGGAGAVWRRARGGDWIRDDAVASEPLNGVAIAAADDVWAVGDGGTVVRYHVKPPAPPPPPEPAPEPAPPPPPPEPAPPAGSSPSPPPQSSSSAPVVRDPAPPPRRARGRRPARRLLTHLRVRRARGRLVVSFRLARSARVRFVARRGRRVVARRTTRALRKGRRRVSLRYRGRRPPTDLNIVVRPVGAETSGRRPDHAR